MISPSREEAQIKNGADTPATRSACSRLRAGFTRTVRFWSSLQVSYHGGKYSIERVLALEEYTKTTSLTRVILVCIGTPVPTAVLITLQELIPLEDPADGSNVNYSFWFRVFMLAAAVCHTYLVQGTIMVEDFTLSWRQSAVFVLGISLIYTAIAVAIGATLVFPIPFFYITMTPAFYIPLLTLLYCLVGNNSKLTKYVCFIAIQKIMGMIYPVYQLLFHKATATRYVLPVVCLLPIIKFAVKNVVLRFTKHLEDLTPEAVIFTVDFYNALYLATCMESASTLNTMLILVVTDFAQTVVVLLSIHRRTATILRRLCQATGATSNHDLLAALSLMCHNPDMLENQFRSGVSVRSCFHHRLNREGQHLLSRLEKLPPNSHCEPRRIYYWSDKVGAILVKPKLSITRASAFSKTLQRISSSRWRSSIQPIVVSPKRRHARVGAGPEAIPADLVENSHILRETLEVLYTIECLMLTSYLEAFIPLFYGNYMMFMVHFPNAKYHTELKNVTRQNVDYTVQFVFLFGLLQVASFVLLIVLLRRNCGIQSLYNLAFVLETQMVLVQGKLMIWMLVTLACRVVHFGADYSFKFDWIHAGN